MKVVVSIRHPAAFVGSLKVADWQYPFNHFLEQKLLIEDFLSPFKAEIQDLVAQKSNLDEIDRWALLWKIMHYRILKYQERHPDWLFVRHEDISQDPLTGFKTIFDYLNLNYSPSLQKTISQYTSAQNSPQNVKTYSKKASRAMNSKANIKSWQKRLSQSEIIRIRRRVEDIANRFYTDSDWE
ncbi:MAG: sulfotransferase domain-containing protein [Pleurocapsa sp. MO_226.B13]|nr:sulfotransferase domain-containing protein [Pleurocapsa sp. MO_226.B13]